MESFDFVCQCSANLSLIEENSLSQHLNVCKNYKGSPFYDFFQQETTLQPLKKLDASQLLQVKNEFQYFLEQIQKVITLNNIQTVDLSLVKVPSLKKQSSSAQNQKQLYDPNVHKNDIVKCTVCQEKLDSALDYDKIYVLEGCAHPYCKPCLIKTIQSDYVFKNRQVACIHCNKILIEKELRVIGGDRMINELEEQLEIETMLNIVTCVQCKDKFEFQCGQWNDAPKDKDGKPYSKEQAEHYADNRFTCRTCKTEQCKGCKITPYHLGFTCEELKKFKKSEHCRFCNQQIVQVQNQIKALQDICAEEDCVAKSKICCLKTLQCGHACSGVVNELYCPPCLHDDCAEKAQQELNITGADYCNICFVEGLNQSPVIVLGCGHVFHYLCAKRKLEIRWPSARITFTYCLCPLCKSWIEFPVESELHIIMQKNIVTFEEIKKKSLERIKFEERMKDKQLVEQDSQYFNKPLEYALAIYAYYECYKCKNSYFGGHKNCQQNMDEGRQNFDVKELVCANCCEVPVEDCKLHGKEFIEFKCKFCCSIAQWFCWGTTHFCEPCHYRECNNDRVSTYTIDKLPVCPGPEQCPLKFIHKPNGEESTLGCSLCRNLKENQKDF